MEGSPMASHTLVIYLSKCLAGVTRDKHCEYLLCTYKIIWDFFMILSYFGEMTSQLLAPQQIDVKAQPGFVYEMMCAAHNADL